MDPADTTVLLEDWGDLDGSYGVPIGARSRTAAGITCTRESYAQWTSEGALVYGTYAASLRDPDNLEGTPVWASPAVLEYRIAARSAALALSVTASSAYQASPTAATHVDVEIATEESGFDGPHVARFRAEQNQATMPGINNVHWGVLQADGSYVDGGSSTFSAYTLTAAFDGSWEINEFAIPTSTDAPHVFQSSGSGSPLAKSPTDSYRVRVSQFHDGWPYFAVVNQIHAWIGPEDPVCRIYPRDDARGITSTARVWPPPKANRLIGGYR